MFFSNNHIFIQQQTVLFFVCSGVHFLFVPALAHDDDETCLVSIKLDEFRKFVLFSVIVENMISPLSSTEKLFVAILARIGINLQMFGLKVI
jgi:hypothetical protein